MRPAISQIAMRVFTKSFYLQTVICICLSLVWHGGLFVALNQLPLRDFDTSRWASQTVEVEFLVKKESPRQKVYIKDTGVGELLLDRLRESVNLLSQKTRRVRSQTVARNSGRDKNVKSSRQGKRSGKSSPRLRLSSRSHFNGTGASLEDSHTHFFTSKEKSLLSHFLSEKRAQFSGKRAQLSEKRAQLSEKRAQLSGKRAQDGEIALGFIDSQWSSSSISTYHPHIKMADITALDTDKGFLEYYTFHIRMREQLRAHWFQLLKEILQRTPGKTLNRMGRVPRVTTLEVILDREGKYVGSIVVDSSQERLLDVAARESFQSAAPFVNPPQGMVEEDGYIYLPFSFRVELNSPHMARSRGSRL